eukprot:CAMPEP_0181214964 /NCGR_PEP_ID=MMETSP1096-20121128/25753_1 /TAXON_ID=156174 ORGANISM="Chrysochromulina ericina, Strain CCMP281" /NCGR_SAMPLE_ID=MMETSP1096 /ASSEMBLY_ACC=CAM_ASM_000453 /LENGTH=122 /DNA_ID=CAMNT_0023306773 /DNA_START=428 /DNA_END=793 /DNA_ORIENTATION=+
MSLPAGREQPLSTLISAWILSRMNGFLFDPERMGTWSSPAMSSAPYLYLRPWMVAACATAICSESHSSLSLSGASICHSRYELVPPGAADASAPCPMSCSLWVQGAHSASESAAPCEVVLDP